MVTMPLDIWADMQEDLGLDTSLLRVFLPVWFAMDDDCRPDTVHIGGGQVDFSGSGFYCDWNICEIIRATGSGWFGDNKEGYGMYLEGKGNGPDDQDNHGDGR